MRRSQWERTRKHLNIRDSFDIYLCDNCGIVREHWRTAKRVRLKCHACKVTGFFYPVPAPPKRKLNYAAMEKRLRDYAFLLDIELRTHDKPEVAVHQREKHGVSRGICYLPAYMTPRETVEALTLCIALYTLLGVDIDGIAIPLAGFHLAIPTLIPSIEHLLNQ